MHRLAPLLAVAITAQACTATIHRHRLPSVDAVIEASDENGVNVSINGGRYRIPAEQIDDIDHPGNVLMVAGGVAYAVGGALTTGSRALPGSDQEALVYGGVVYIVMGLAMAIGGGIAWATSRGRAMQYEHGRKTEKPYLPIDCAPVSGTDFKKCTEPAPAETLPDAARRK